MDEKVWSLTIERMLDGGFVVTSTPRAGLLAQMLFACTTADEALAYVKGRIACDSTKHPDGSRLVRAND